MLTLPSFAPHFPALIGNLGKERGSSGSESIACLAQDRQLAEAHT